MPQTSRPRARLNEHMTLAGICFGPHSGQIRIGKCYVHCAQDKVPAYSNVRDTLSRLLFIDLIRTG